MTSVLRFVLCFFLFDTPLHAQKRDVKTNSITTGGSKMRYQEYRLHNGAALTRTAVFLLYGTGGFRSPNFPFSEMISDLISHDVLVIVPSFEDATSGSLISAESSLPKWVTAIQDLARQVHARPDVKNIVIVGYSLGASVGLAAATASEIAAVADCSGSLPDAYVTTSAHLPPLLIVHNVDDPVMPIFNAKQLQRLCGLNNLTCDVHLMPRGGHAFTGLNAVTVRHLIIDFLSRYS